MRDLVHAKLNDRVYEGMISPEELMDFLKKFKIVIQNGKIKIDGKFLEGGVPFSSHEYGD